MFTTEENRELRKLKAEKRLRLLRKWTLTTRNKAIRLYQLRWFKDATTVLSPTLTGQADANKRYVSAFKELRNNREFNYFLYNRNAFSKCQQLRATISSTRRPTNRLIRPLPNTIRVAQVSRLLVSRYRRHLRSTPQPVGALFPEGDKQEVRPGRGRRDGSHRSHTKIRSVGSYLLVHRAASGLQTALLPAPAANERHSNLLLPLFDTQAAAITVKELAEHLVRTATKTDIALVAAGPIAKTQTPLRHRPEKKGTYAAARSRLLLLTKRLSVSRRAAPKYGRRGRRAAGIRRLASQYPRLKGALRGRFFARQPLAALFTRSQLSGLPKLNPAQTWAARRLVRTRTQRAYWNGPALLPAAATSFPNVISSRAAYLEKSTPVLNLLKRVQSTHAPQQSKRLRSSSLRARLLVTGAQVLSSLSTYRAAKGIAAPILRLHAPSKRQRRRAARSALLKRNVSKGQRKRIRLGRIQQKVKAVRYPATHFVAKLGAEIVWKHRPPFAHRRRTYRHLGAITSALTLFNKLYKKQECHTIPTPHPIKTSHLRIAWRVTLWSLLATAKGYRKLVVASTENSAAADLLVQKLRRALRRESTISVGQITRVFLFLLQAWSGHASATRKLLYPKFRSWLQALRQTAQAPLIKGKKRPVSALLRAVDNLRSRRGTRRDARRAAQLLRLMAGGKTAPSHKSPALLKQLTAKLRSVDSKRLQLRSVLVHKEPRAALKTLPVSGNEVSSGLSPSAVEVAPFSYEPFKALTTTVYWAPSLTSTFTTQHASTVVPKYTHPKKHLMRPVEWRKSRFVRFVPRRTKRSLLRKATRAHNKATAPGPYVPILRYFRYVYRKRGRIFVVRRRKEQRIAAKHLVKHQRWNRATVLRLRRCRPVWRFAPQGRQVRASTSRVITHAPRVVTGGGWRLRKARVKRRSLLHAQTEQFKSLIQQAAAFLPAGAGGAHVNVAPRLLRLVTANNSQLQLLPGAVRGNTGGTQVAAFYRVQRKLAAQRALRAAAATSKFSSLFARTIDDQYKRRRGRFVLINDRGRKQPRKPRWVRAVSKNSTTLNFAPQSRELTSFSSTSHSTTTTTPQLRKQLWAGVHQYQSRRVKVYAKKTRPLPSTAIPTNLPERTTLIRKIRRLSLIKKLLRGNKFNKLARLGELNALGEEYKALSSLGNLFELGGFTEELKQQLLLQLATEIKFCAALCAQKTYQSASTYAAASHTSERTLLTYRKLPVTFGRDPDFFISDTLPERVSDRQVLQKASLLKVLTAVKGVKVTSASAFSKRSNFVLTRSAEASLLPRIKHLQHYQRVPAPRKAEPSYQYDREEQIALLWDWEGLALPKIRKNTTPNSLTQQQRVQKSAVQHKVSGIRSRRTAKFAAASKLPLEYEGTQCVVISPKLWAYRLGHWIRKVTVGNRATPSFVRSVPKSFSTSRPWGVKTLYSGSIAHDYERLTVGAAEDMLALKAPKVSRFRRSWTGLSGKFTSMRLAAIHAARAHSRPVALHFSPGATGKKFWQLQVQGREHVQSCVEQRAKALIYARVRATPTIKATRPSLGLRAVKEAKVKEVEVPQAFPKYSFESLHVKKLNITVFDETVRNNLQKFGDLPHAARAMEQGYELIKRAYKAALSSQERNPALPEPRFAEQKSAVHTILVSIAGVAPINDVVLDWKQLPKNRVVPPQATAVVHTPPSVPQAPPNELTLAELELIRDEVTRRDLKKFAGLAPQARQTDNAHTLVRKAVLRSWTHVEDSTVPAESLFYTDLLLAAKAYSFYNITLDLTSRATTAAKIAPNFAKLPK